MLLIDCPLSNVCVVADCVSVAMDSLVVLFFAVTFLQLLLCSGNITGGIDAQMRFVWMCLI